MRSIKIFRLSCPDSIRPQSETEIRSVSARVNAESEYWRQNRSKVSELKSECNFFKMRYLITDFRWFGAGGV